MDCYNIEQKLKTKGVNDEKIRRMLHPNDELKMLIMRKNEVEERHIFRNSQWRTIPFCLNCNVTTHDEPDIYKKPYTIKVYTINEEILKFIPILRLPAPLDDIEGLMSFDMSTETDVLELYYFESFLLEKPRFQKPYLLDDVFLVIKNMKK